MTVRFELQFVVPVTDYHRQLVDDKFRRHLMKFVKTVLLPKVEFPLSYVTGEVAAVATQERFCGPLSAIRDIFSLKLTFHGSETVSYSAGIEYLPATGEFRGCGRLPEVGSRRKARLSIAAVLPKMRGLKQILEELTQGGRQTADCPYCSAPLDISNTDIVLVVRCVDRCFYRYVFPRIDGALTRLWSIRDLQEQIDRLSEHLDSLNAAS